MAHELYENDQMISGRNITPWHRLGEITDEIGIADLHRIMGWDVEKILMATMKATGIMPTGEKISIPSLITSSYATVRLPRNENESPILLGAGMSESYQVLQNRDLIQLVEPFVEQGCAIETAGTLKNGQRVWIMLRLAKDLHVGQNDVIQKYIMVSNDHTGRQAARFGLVGIRVVCMNTLNMAENSHYGTSQLMRIFHQGNVNESLKTVASMLDHVNGKFVNYAINLDMLTKKNISQVELKRYIADCFKPTYSQNRRDTDSFIEKTEQKIIQLFESGAGSDLKEANGTVYGAYQAVNAYLNHNKNVALDTRLPSLVWGHRANTDKRALNLALKLAA
jgi:phage/plasmid-related protein TIGR03299